MRCFSSKAVATIALWKAAPMILGYSWGCLQESCVCDGCAFVADKTYVTRRAIVMSV